MCVPFRKAPFWWTYRNLTVIALAIQALVFLVLVHMPGALSLRAGLLVLFQLALFRGCRAQARRAAAEHEAGRTEAAFLACRWRRPRWVEPDELTASDRGFREHVLGGIPGACGDLYSALRFIETARLRDARSWLLLGTAFGSVHLTWARINDMSWDLQLMAAILMPFGFLVVADTAREIRLRRGLLNAGDARQSAAIAVINDADLGFDSGLPGGLVALLVFFCLGVPALLLGGIVFGASGVAVGAAATLGLVGVAVGAPRLVTRVNAAMLGALPQFRFRGDIRVSLLVAAQDRLRVITFAWMTPVFLATALFVLLPMGQAEWFAGGSLAGFLWSGAWLLLVWLDRGIAWQPQCLEAYQRAVAGLGVQVEA